MSRKSIILVAVLLIGLGLDLVSKLLVLHSMPIGSQIPILPGFFNLVHVHNKGAAFSLLNSISVGFTRPFFITTTGLVLAVVGYLWWRLPKTNWPAALGYSLIMAGAVGNLIDRVRLGEVVDFLDFYWGRYHWPAFNVADSLVCLGAAVLVWVILTEKEKPGNASDPA
ncbi:MAG: signal peptidase II [Deltaproteobacteria bacterium]|nr:signal peptidase II [Deltaproteobacteria bacterium]